MVDFEEEGAAPQHRVVEPGVARVLHRVARAVALRSVGNARILEVEEGAVGGAELQTAAVEVATHNAAEPDLRENDATGDPRELVLSGERGQGR